MNMLSASNPSLKLDCTAVSGSRFSPTETSRVAGQPTQFGCQITSAQSSFSLLPLYNPRRRMETDSYPPEFRQFAGQGSRSDSGDFDSEEEPSVPCLDLKRLNLEEDRFADACQAWGLFYLLNHDVPVLLLSRVMDHARKLFSLPFETKQVLFTEPLSYFWGTPALTPSGAALSCGPRNFNWVEGVNVPCTLLPHLESRDALVNDFRVLIEEYGQHMARVADQVFDAMAKTMNLHDWKQSNRYLSEATGFVRVYRYPQCEVPEDCWGMGRHTDSSVISILCQDHVGGLEVLRDGKWRLVHPLPNSLVVNLGDMAQAISDDKYSSAEHRVRASRFADRLSICYFAFPPPDSVIQSTRYRPFTYKDFQQQVQEDIKTLGNKVGLGRFRLPNVTG